MPYIFRMKMPVFEQKFSHQREAFLHETVVDRQFCSAAAT